MGSAVNFRNRKRNLVFMARQITGFGRWHGECQMGGSLPVVRFSGRGGRREGGCGGQRRESAPAAASHLPGRTGVPDGPGGCPSHLRVGEQGVDARPGRPARRQDLDAPHPGRGRGRARRPRNCRTRSTRNSSPTSRSPRYRSSSCRSTRRNISSSGTWRSPGPFSLRSETSILQALSLAGGFTQFASPRSIKLIRNTAGKQEVRKINYNNMIDEDGEGNYLLKSGDTIVVP